MILVEGLLHRVQYVALRDTFDGRYLASACLDREERA
jgi:hypothetical protein